MSRDQDIPKRLVVLPGARAEEIVAERRLADAAGHKVYFLVPHDVESDDEDVLPYLDLASFSVADELARAQQLQTFAPQSPLADRVRMVAEALPLGPNDEIHLPKATLVDLNAIWFYILCSATHGPRLRLDISNLLPETLPASRGTNDVDLLLSLFRRRRNVFTQHGFEVSTNDASTTLELFGTADSGDLPDSPPPLSIHIAPLWNGVGSSHVFNCQLDALHTLGHDILTVHVDVDDLATSDPPRLENELAACEVGYAMQSWLLKRDPDYRDAPHNTTGAVGLHQRPHLSFETESRVARLVAVPSTLADTIRNRSISNVVCNYGFLMPVVEKLGLIDSHVICETHDVRAEQHRIQNLSNRVQPSNALLERAAWSQADHLVFINDRERSNHGRDLQTETTVAYPMMARPQVNRSDKVTVDSDLVLFVGSDHEANVRSLDWYLREVHLAHLAPRDVQLTVAGTIERAYPLPVPSVNFLGRVDDLESLYDAAQVVVIPIVEGTGFPIKLLDAISRNLPWIATRRLLDSNPTLEPYRDHFAETAEDFVGAVRGALVDNSSLRTMEPAPDWRGDYLAAWKNALVVD